jgi:hypothetical protein
MIVNAKFYHLFKSIYIIIKVMEEYKKVVLVVEDEKPLLEAIKIKLEKNGFEVIHVKNYWQCLSLGYVLMRANLPISPEILKKLRLPVWYYLGQRTIVAKKI